MSYLLSIDPASSTGIALFDLETHELLEVYTLTSRHSDTWGARSQSLIEQFNICCREYIKDIEVIAYERSKTTSLIVIAIPLLFAEACPRAFMSDATAVTPSEWKAYVRRRVDCSHIPVKGIDALDALVPGIIEDYEIDSDDAADAVLLGKAFLASLKDKTAGNIRRSISGNRVKKVSKRAGR
jgi:hypothetical protein